VIHAVEMNSGAMIYISSFMTISSGIPKLIGGDTHTDIQTHRHSELIFLSE
jgi:hypothetical protein